MGGKWFNMLSTLKIGKQKLKKETVMNTTIENNKIIAEFMGYIDNGCSEEGFLINPITNFDEEINDLRYHLDWNWLMEAIEKCLIGEAEHDDEKAKKAISEIYESLCSINISATYKSVVEFIKWYNEQNKV